MEQDRGLTAQEKLPGVPDDDSEWKLAVSELKRHGEKRGALSAHLLETDHDLLQLVLVWPTISNTRNPHVKGPRPNSRVKAEDSVLMKKAWAGISVSYKSIAKAIGCRQAEAKKLVSRAKSMCLIWPDGTVNSLLEDYLGARLGRDMVKAMSRT